MRLSIARPHETPYGLEKDASSQERATGAATGARSVAPGEIWSEIPTHFGTGGYASIQWRPIQSPLRPGCDGQGRAARLEEGVEILSAGIILPYELTVGGQNATHAALFQGSSWRLVWGAG